MNNSTNFSQNPINLKTSRSKFRMSPSHCTTFNAGELVPIMNYELVQPGDTFKVSAKFLIRSTTPLCPVMDDAYMDVYFFFIPHKILLSRETMSNQIGAAAAARSFKAWIGAQDSLINVPYPEHNAIPTIASSKVQRVVGSLLDHLGYPLGSQYQGTLFTTPWSVLSYFSVYNHFFRDPNTMNPISFTISTSSSTPTGFIISPTINGNNSWDKCQFACRRHGYFGSALPWPQRNSEAISLPLGSIAEIKLMNNGSTPVTYAGGTYQVSAAAASNVQPGALGNPMFSSISGASGKMVADLSGATAATINQLRTAFALQRYYEKLARGGNSLQDMTKALFGVTPHDFNDDCPEFLGGKSIKIQNHLVANTAGTTYSTEEQQSIGSTGAFSLTNDGDYYFTKSFDTWGTLMCITVVRPRESFSQGLDRQATKFDAIDLYDPTKAHLGEMPIYKKELYADGSAADDEVFGYQEAFAEYRMMPDKTTGYLRNGQSLSYWTYVNNFESHPTLAGYLKGNTLADNIDNTLQVKRAAAGLQYMLQADFDIEAVRAMPTYSIPGLIDHD